MGLTCTALTTWPSVALTPMQARQDSCSTSCTGKQLGLLGRLQAGPAAQDSWWACTGAGWTSWSLFPLAWPH